MHAELMIAGKTPETENICAAAKKTKADVVILSEPTIGQWQNYGELLCSRPHLKVLSITNDGHHFFLHRLRPVRTALGEVSPERLVDAIVSSAECDWN
jgi:hypothetical protein